MLELCLLGYWSLIALNVFPWAKNPLTLANLLFFTLVSTMLAALMVGLALPLASWISQNLVVARALLTLAVAIVIFIPVYMLRGFHRKSEDGPNQLGLTPES